MINSYYKRIQIQYFTYGGGLLLSALRCYSTLKINEGSNSDNLLTLQFLIVGVVLAVSCIVFLYSLYTMELKWDLKLSKEQSFWKMRPEADNGIWLTTLFPLALLIGNLSHPESCSTLYQVTTILTLGFMLSSLIFLYKVMKQNVPPVQFLFYLIWPLSIILALVVHHITSLNMVAAFPICFITQSLFLTLVVVLTSHCPHSFTVGEVFTVAQAVAALFTVCLLWFLKRTVHILCYDGKKCNYGSETTQILQVLSLCCGIILAAVSMKSFFKKPIPFYSLCVGTVTLVIYPAWFYVIAAEPIGWILHFCFQSFYRRLLLADWVICGLVAISIVAWRNIKGLRATTIVRKYFHGIIIMIYLPGLVLDPELLFLASGVAFAVFIIIEMLRILEMPPFGQVFDSALRIFLDEKDSGNLMLTHIYLLVGCSLPLWIIPSCPGFCLALLSGVLALGFGDTAASVGGTMWGKHKLLDSKKSLEGLICAIVVQLLVTLLIPSLYFGEVSFPTLDVVHIYTATLLCCGMEAFTNQVDNLVSPLFLYLMLVGLC